jgi:Methyltransferase FkbM domain
LRPKRSTNFDLIQKPYVNEHPMTAIDDILSGDICLLVLGSIGDRPGSMPVDIQRRMRGIFLDAVNARVEGGHMRIEPLQNIVAATKGEVTLTQRRWIPCSSIYPPFPAVLADFGMEEYYEPVAEIRGAAVTLTDLAARYGIVFDYIKTDIEGLDGPVIQSAGAALNQCLVVTMELRFLPNYEGEPYFDEVVRDMRTRGFEVLRVDVENWRYDTSHRAQFFDGRSVHADVTFVRTPKEIMAGPNPREGLVRQIIILTMIGRFSYAEHVLEKYLVGAPAALRSELNALIVKGARRDTIWLARWTGLPELQKLYRAARSKVGRMLKDKSGFKLTHIGS